MEKLKCPQCHSEFELEDLCYVTKLGGCIVYCSTCRMWRDEDEYVIMDPHTCANCHFQQNDHCSRIVRELSMYVLNVPVKPDFSCSLWKEREEEPFCVEEYSSTWGIAHRGNSCSQCFPHLDSARRICDWLNSLWKGDNNESS